MVRLKDCVGIVVVGVGFGGVVAVGVGSDGESTRKWN
jgi:hypothetical protein